MSVVTATGPGATRVVASVEAFEPLLVAFVRGTARWLDPWFPQRGRRGEPAGQVVEELDFERRGLRLIRHADALELVAVGLEDATLALRWSYVVAGSEIRGTSVQLTVDGPHHASCIADFETWFGANQTD